MTEKYSHSQEWMVPSEKNIVENVTFKTRTLMDKLLDWNIEDALLIEEDDYDEIFALAKKSFSEKWFPRFKWSFDEHIWRKEIWLDDGRVLFKKVINGKIVGVYGTHIYGQTAYAYHTPDYPGLKYCHAAWFFVDPDCWSSIAFSMGKSLLKEVEKRWFDWIRIETDSWTKGLFSSREYLERLGLKWIVLSENMYGPGNHQYLYYIDITNKFK